MASSTDVYIFGDQTLCVLKNLQNLLLVHDNAPLSIFLDEAFSVVHREISCLPSTEKDRFPRAETFGLLLDAIQNGKHHAALDSACVCVYEIGSYLQ